MERLLELWTRLAADGSSIFCWAVAIVLLVSAGAKLRNAETFRLICAGYPGASWIGVRRLAPSIILVEIAAGVAILVPDRWSLLIGIALALLWSVIASGGVALRRLRGEQRFRCGCGADLSQESSADWVLLRNAPVMAGLAAALAGGGARAVGIGEAPLLLVAVGLVLAMHLVAAASRTWGRVREWATAG